MYDAVTLVSAVPVLRERLYSSDDKHKYDCSNCRTNLVYGQCSDMSGILDPEKLGRLLRDASLAGLSFAPEPYPIVIFTDPGQDLDDELALVLLSSLAERGFVRAIGLVANLHPSVARARLAKGTLKQLGLGQIPVAAGSDGGCTMLKDEFSDSAFAYVAGEDEIEMDAESMLRRVLMDEEQHSVIFLCLSSLTDAARFVRDNEQLFIEKVHSVTIMGGVEVDDHYHFDLADELSCSLVEHSELGSDGCDANSSRASREVSFLPLTRTRPPQLVKPDSANNNTFDMNAAVFFYKRLQELGVKMSVLTRFATYGCAIPRCIYDDMQATGSPIALRLHDVQKKSIEELWKRCNATGEQRCGLPPRCNKEWYMKTFLGGSGGDRLPTDSIWDLVLHFNMYDPLALILSVPPVAWIFFQPTANEKIDAPVRVVGSSDNPGIVRTDMLRQFLIENLIDGVRRSVPIHGRRASDTRLQALGPVPPRVKSISAGASKEVKLPQVEGMHI